MISAPRFTSTDDVFKNDLLPEETILWRGRPDPKIIFSPADVFLIPFSLLWGGFAIFWEMAALGFASPSVKANQPAPIFFPLFGVPFVLAGLYVIMGRFFFKSWKKRRTWYAVTNRRVLVLSQGVSRYLQAAALEAIPTVNKTVRNDGSGTIRFGNCPFWFSMYQNSGMDFFGGFYGPDVPIFHDIKNVEEVYRLVSQHRK